MSDTKMNTSSKTIKAICPECEWEFEVEEPEVNEVFICEDCGLNLKVTEIDLVHHRLALKLTETDADDWGE